ncbi:MULTISPECIES: LLM class flavin-dependent oxidoreductase [unclassified Xanthobacter]|uniref:LLM class flavin-dependent oxidoreductase n=1 Tax=unclassified Xanthobacter TaxID=2623496 RepID=UPI001F48E419|nr:MULTISPECIES: LLM class flavin-dependent oxidoreductase [unclassified Xanthobacter]
MQFGLFCTYENPRQDYVSAYAEQTELVRLVEDLGFEEAWVAEHHFNPGAASPSCLALLAYLAGQTSRIRLGSAAVLLPFREPISVAEDVATVDILSGGRLNLGVAKGGPFPVQNKHFHTEKETSRAKTLEALTVIEKLLYEPSVTFKGDFFDLDGVELVPRPVQSPIPTFFATATGEALELAAARGYGVMAAPPFPLDGARESLRIYRQAAPAADPRFTLIRFYHVAATREQAVAEAQAFLRPFVERMQATTQQAQPNWTPWFALDRMIADSLVGTVDDVETKLAAFATDLAPRTVLLKPLCPDFAKRRADIELFAKVIRPNWRSAA